MLRVVFFLTAFSLAGFAQTDPQPKAPPIQFKADYYTRDLNKNVVHAKGNAWVRQGDKEVWADEIDIDFSTNRATANGNVHIREGDMDIWARHGNYNLRGEDALLENATIISGQMVITGDVVRKLDRNRFEIEEGTYTNCNITHLKGPDAAECSYAWKIYGKFFSVTMEEYAHVYDAILYIKDLPIMYFPYFVAPIKTSRQSGLLMLEFTHKRSLGSGTRIPYFLVLGPWHDLTFTPTYYSSVGYHLSTEYRYVYSGRTNGKAKFTLMERRFGPDRANPAPQPQYPSRFLGAVGEWGIDLKNTVGLGRRSHTRQRIHAVSDPFYTFDYSEDIVGSPYDASLRSFISFTSPGDHLLFTAKVEHHQSLLIPKDGGIDRGAVTELPTLSFSQSTVPFLDQYFAYEFDSELSNFFRPTTGFDSISSTFTKSGVGAYTLHSDPNSSYHDGNYIRTGRRLRLEPRLIANVPMPPGFQFQPTLRGGAYLYHFDFPNSGFTHREYLETELPVSLYFSKTFETGLDGFEKINHVFQPRFIYANSLYQRDSTHPFFFRDNSKGLSNPRFDILDQITPFEYMRFELINRFRRKSGPTIERFFLIQLSEQYNLRTSNVDPRFTKRVGPIELLSEMQYGAFTGSIEAQYNLETTPRPSNPGEEVHEYDWSSTFLYRKGEWNFIRLTNRFRIRADDLKTDQLAYINAAKTLPVFFDISGALEYSLKKGELLSYRIGFLFRSKPLSCWKLSIDLGRDAVQEYFANFSFELDFGSPGTIL